MNDKEPLDLGPIKERLERTGLVGKTIHRLDVNEMHVQVEVITDSSTGGYYDYDSLITDEQEVFFTNAPTDIAALVAEVERLRGELKECYQKRLDEVNEKLEWFSE